MFNTHNKHIDHATIYMYMYKKHQALCKYKRCKVIIEMLGYIVNYVAYTMRQEAKHMVRMPKFVAKMI